MKARILNASAGSGKTYRLAYKYVRDVVEQPHLYRTILAVTFTNKATEEMKSRILGEIHKLASGGESAYMPELRAELAFDEQTIRQRAKEARSHILHDYSRFTILTIDTFFQRILRAFIKELGIDLNYNVEIETASVLTKSADTLVEEITVDAELKSWLTAFVEERIEEGKRWDVRDGILSLGGELFKEKNKEALSLAGSKNDLGKIVGMASERAAADKVEITATARKAMEIMAAEGLTPSDFSGKSRSFANYFATTAAGEIKPYTATVRKMSLTTEGWCAKGSAAECSIDRLQPLLASICESYDRNLKHWNTTDLLRENYRSFALLADLYAKVQLMCDRENMMLLSETKYILSEFIDRNDAPFIYEKVGNRYDRFMIDEFQDTSSREWENFLPLLNNAISQSEETSVLIVGDIKQSIYRWRGGDWKILHDKAADALGRHNVENVALQENFRSLPQIVNFNNNIISAVVGADNTTLNAAIAEAAEERALSQAEAERLKDTLADAYADHIQSPRRKGEGYVSITTYEGEPQVVERIKELIDKGFRPKDIMILVRSGTDGAKTAKMLLEFKRTNDDPHYRFDVMTQEVLIIGNSPAASFITAAMRLAINAGDAVSRAIYNKWKGRMFDIPLSDNEMTFFRSIRLLSPEEAFERIIMANRLQAAGEHTAYIQALHEQIINFCAGRIADIPLFLKWWDEHGHNRSLSVEESDTTVEITTIHKAKGLEKRAVIIPYCNWALNPKTSGQTANIVWATPQGAEFGSVGRFPVRYKAAMAQSMFSAEYYRETVYSHVDNVNLLYVALTRAAESLHIFIPTDGSKAPNVGNLILQSLSAGNDEARIGDMTGRYSATDNGEKYEFGLFAAPVEEKKSNGGRHSVLLGDYPTDQADMRLRLPSERYFEDGGEAELSPRNLGILMHKAFAEAESREDIYAAIRRMEADSLISGSEADTITAMTDKALANPVAAGWFGGQWQRVRNENEIIVPDGKPSRRPDRVMIKDKSAVVVDYKFGERETEKYRRQIDDYIDLLRRMGYKEVEGYLWYVKLGRIEKVELDIK